MAIRAERKETRLGEYLNGIPNRDLDQDEYAGMTSEQRALVAASGLWSVKTDAEMRPTKRDAPAAPASTTGGGDS